MPRPDRSRSRLGPTSNKISRAIASFGRYPHKRPPGLEVNGNGEFRLENLMNVWGLDQGLTEEDVLTVIHENMFHGQRSTLRFVINTDGQGKILVCVKPSRRGEDQPSRRREHQPSGRREHPVSGRALDSRQPSPRNYSSKLHGNMQEMLDMELEEVIRCENQAPRELPNKSTPGNLLPEWPQTHTQRQEAHETPEYAARVHRSMEQMGLTTKTQHIRQAPRHASREMHQRNNGKEWKQRGNYDVGGKHSGRSVSEQIQRWVGWMLRKGCDELGLNRTEIGWVNVTELAMAMKRSRPDFGEFDGEMFMKEIEQNDAVGRFEFYLGHIRKVPKGSCSRRVPRRSQSVTSVESLHSSRSPPGRPSPVPMQIERSGSEEAPPPPPGKNWTKYQDGDHFWWYYEGSLGKWWCDEGSKPQRYDENP